MLFILKLQDLDMFILIIHKLQMLQHHWMDLLYHREDAYLWMQQNHKLTILWTIPISVSVLLEPMEVRYTWMLQMKVRNSLYQIALLKTVSV